eukprot:gnl/MRDRNA2_/MRDRNA2_157651_c0_seq1.p1 gnl/MRDRNA2_/MRDRNA2_157651_c0~~gnl/MRDRNA2_/MRDRNA2_157651_c0_seq1.p1  ORF type:complete len:414 (+),score=96.69 gnl/MRDRNA2_/MRDRNA2_157651_c0_seq1:106-1347(+)
MSSQDSEKEQLLKTFQKLDRNGDGMITRDEFIAFTQKLDPSGESCFDEMFDELDVNKDGILQYEEIVDFIFQVEAIEHQKAETGGNADILTAIVNMAKATSSKLRIEVGQIVNITKSQGNKKSSHSKDQMQKMQATKLELEKCLQDINSALQCTSGECIESSQKVNNCHANGVVDVEKIEKMKRMQALFAPTSLCSFATDGSVARCKQVLDRFPEAVSEGLGDGATAALIAAKNAHKDVLELLIERRADVDRADCEGATATLAAAENGHLKVLQLLVGAAADLNKPNNQGVTPLFKAAQNSHLDVIKLLIGQRSDPNKADKNGRTPVWAACSDGYIEVVTLLIGARADLDTVDKMDGETPACAAATIGNAQILQHLIDARADVHKATYNGETPLSLAKQDEHSEAIQVLESVK